LKFSGLASLDHLTQLTELAGITGISSNAKVPSSLRILALKDVKDLAPVLALQQLQS
jgi:hypothetical protein